jgi:hypothetical protein
MRTMIALIFALGVIVSLGPEAYAQETKPSIFVGPLQRDGFVDIEAGIRDSIQDIQLGVSASWEIRAAHAERGANVVSRRQDGRARSIGLVGRQSRSGETGVALTECTTGSGLRANGRSSIVPPSPRSVVRLRVCRHSHDK